MNLKHMRCEGTQRSMQLEDERRDDKLPSSSNNLGTAKEKETERGGLKGEGKLGE